MEGDDMDGLCPSFLQFGLFHENEVIDLYWELTYVLYECHEGQVDAYP